MSKRWLFGGVMLALVAAAPILSLARDAHARPVLRADDDETPKMVELVMTDGRVIKAEILSETSTEYRVLAFLMEGFPAVETTFKKSNVQEVRTLDADAAPKTPAKNDLKADDPKNNDANAKDQDSAARIILTRVDGEIGYDFSPTPLKKFFKLVDETFNDLDSRGNVVTEHRQDHIVIFHFNTQTFVQGGIDGLFSIMDIKEIIQDEMKKGRRVVFWVEKAINGAAVLPMMSPEIFFSDNGIMLVTRDLEDFGQGGDDVVIEKQISLRMGHAEGFPILGGYTDIGPQIVRSMLRSTHEFWYKKVGGKVVATTEKPPADEINDWIQLSDDGKDENEDDMDDLDLVYGNDRLWLDASRAYDLGIAKAICNTTDDIAFHLGVGRNYKLALDDGGAEVFRRWHNELERTMRLISQGGNGRPEGELWKEYRKAGELNTVQAQLGRQKNVLEKVVALLRKYKEVFDPSGEAVAQYNVQIELLRQQIMQANSQN